MLLWIIALISTALYAQLIEYAAHRWLMHRPIPWRTSVFTEHAIEHHSRSRNDINISIPPWTVIAASFLLFAWVSVLGWTWAAAQIVICGAYSGVWTCLHHAHHDLGFRFVKRIPWYSIWRRHHLAHHAQPTRNFGAVFLWMDYVMGTKATG